MACFNSTSTARRQKNITIIIIGFVIEETPPIYIIVSTHDCLNPKMMRKIRTSTTTNPRTIITHHHYHHHHLRRKECPHTQPTSSFQDPHNTSQLAPYWQNIATCFTRPSSLYLSLPFFAFSLLFIHSFLCAAHPRYILK